MNNYDSLDYQIHYLSTYDNQKSPQFLEKSFEFEINDKENKTQLDNIFLNLFNSEQFDSSNIDIVQQNLINKIGNNTIPQNIPNNSENQPELKIKKLLGRKRKNSGEKGVHNKYSEDNLLRKIKPKLKSELRKLINFKIKEDLDLSKITFNGNRYKKIEIINIKQDQVIDVDVENNKKLLNTKIKDFFSVERSGNYSSYPKNYNELLIQKIYEIDKDKKVTCVLEKTFLECLKYFRMDKEILNNPNFSCLKGLENGYLELKNNLLKEGDELLYNKLIYSIKNFEKIILKRTARTKRKKIE